jgi:Right handed beta helix region
MDPADDGILLYNSRRGGPRLSHVTISGVDVSGFGNGIAVGAQYSTGFADVQVSNSALHDNLDSGFVSYGPFFDPARPVYANAGISLRRVVAYGNLGDPANTRTNSGSGMVLGSVDGAQVSWSTAYDNGGKGRAAIEGPEGVWSYDATQVVLAHDLAYRNTSASRADGGGFDLDEGTTGSTIEYCLSYANHGPGFLLYGSKTVPQSGNVVRFSISSGDGLTPGTSAGILVSGEVSDDSVYQNTVVMGPSRAAAHSAIGFGPLFEAVTVRNNILVADGSEPAVRAAGATVPAALELQGNDYVSASGAVEWGPRTYPSLAAWRAATGQEEAGGKAVGLSADPMLAGPDLNLTVRLATDAGIGSGFELAPASPARGSGLGLLALYGVQAGGTDFAGQPVSASAPDVGAQ